MTPQGLFYPSLFFYEQLFVTYIGQSNEIDTKWRETYTLLFLKEPLCFLLSL